jgi:hypothetical protein
VTVKLGQSGHKIKSYVVSSLTWTFPHFAFTFPKWRSNQSKPLTWTFPVILDFSKIKSHFSGHFSKIETGHISGQGYPLTWTFPVDVGLFLSTFPSPRGHFSVPLRIYTQGGDGNVSRGGVLKILNHQTSCYLDWWALDSQVGATTEVEMNEIQCPTGTPGCPCLAAETADAARHALADGTDGRSVAFLPDGNPNLVGVKRPAGQAHLVPRAAAVGNAPGRTGASEGQTPEERADARLCAAQAAGLDDSWWES